MSTYQVKTITTITPTFASQWQSVWESAENANLFNSYDWFVMATKTGHVSSYQITAVYNQDILVAVAPLTSDSVFGVTVLSPLNNHFIVNTPFLLATYDKELVKALFDTLLKNTNIYINKMDAKITEILYSLYPKALYPLIAANPYVDLHGDPLRLILKPDLSKIRRVMRKYDEHLEFTIYTDPKDLEQWVEKIFAIDQNSAKQKRAMGVFESEENREIFRNFVRYLHRYIQIAVLSYDKKAIAYAFNFACKDVYLQYQVSYLYDYRTVAPGKITTTKLLSTMKGTNYTMFDFSGGISSYKQDFTPLFYLQYNLCSSPNPLVMLWWRAINSGRRIKQILFPLKNTRDHEFLFKTYTQTSSKE